GAKPGFHKSEPYPKTQSAMLFPFSFPPIDTGFDGTKRG
ncbi:MAG: hypothetical protein ACJAUW_002086, partial [Yoonia sp.]